MKKKWYIVLKGKVPGVNDDLHDRLAQVNEFPGNSCKEYKTKEEAEVRYKKHIRKKNRSMKTFFFIPILLIVIGVELVDALYKVVDLLLLITR
jgi:hypothetical protein